MASSQRPQAGSLPRQTGFRATDNPEVEDHARDRWYERVLDRFPDIDISVDVAWREAERVSFGTHNATFGRYFVEGDAVLIARRKHTGRAAETRLVTVLKREQLDKPAVAVRAVDRLHRERGRQ